MKMRKETATIEAKGKYTDKQASRIMSVHMYICVCEYVCLNAADLVLHFQRAYKFLAHFSRTFCPIKCEIYEHVSACHANECASRQRTKDTHLMSICICVWVEASKICAACCWTSKFKFYWVVCAHATKRCKGVQRWQKKGIYCAII